MGDKFRALGQMAFRKLVLLILKWLFGLLVPILPLIIVLAVIVVIASSFLSGLFGGLDIHGALAMNAKQNQKLEKKYEKAANQWKKGLDVKQQALVKMHQLDMPYSVLMAMAKYVDNFNPPNADVFYNELKPTYHWKQEIATYTYFSKTKKGCKSNTVKVKVWELLGAEVWDGTYTARYKIETQDHTHGCSGYIYHGPTEVYSHMDYDQKIFTKVGNSYGFTKKDMDPMFYEPIYAIQSNLHQMLNDPIVQEWGSVFGEIVYAGSAPPPDADGKVANPKQVKQWIDQALSITNSPSSWEPYLMKMVGHESSGNIYDVNPEGVRYYKNSSVLYHAEGLMQLMIPTFRAYALPGYNSNIFDPLSNMIASIEYIKNSRKFPPGAAKGQGTPLAIDGIGNNKPYGGY